jgi:hypothetical protein
MSTNTYISINQYDVGWKKMKIPRLSATYRLEYGSRSSERQQAGAELHHRVPSWGRYQQYHEYEHLHFNQSV